MPIRRAPLVAIAAAAAAVGAAPLLSGCTVPVAGVAGVTVGKDGSPVGVIAMCEEHVDGATLHTDAEDPGAQEDAGVWKHDGPITGLTTWPLASPGDGWTAEKPFGRLAPGQAYRMYAWTEDDSWSTSGVSFTTEDLAALTPGQVRYGADDMIGTAPLEDFREKACEGF
ncbi:MULTISPECIES: hypothetical protein [unclassified Streptomyces]|uniref:hypothetical protein n=1 Tax=unclassified Streptomyces TaxID=2593676 RepID=UPI0036C43A41